MPILIEETILDNKLAADILSVFNRLHVADGQELLDVAKVLFSRDPNDQSEGRDYAMQAIMREAEERIHEGEMDHPLSPLLHDVTALSREHFQVVEV
jgi:uncharacterized protein (DUF111 family)